MVFKKSEALNPDDPMDIACGQCIGCKMKKAQDWAIRISHEAQYHEQNIFLTLTFTEQELAFRDNPGSLDVKEVQRFIKRLRNHIDRKEDGRKIRYYAVGEYGELTGRPHYHIIIFGWEPKDGILWKTSKKGSRLFNSEILSQLWPYGYINYGQVTWDSASYTAGYITKKFNDTQVEDRLKWTDPITGELKDKDPEFAVMSRRPGIGSQWIEDHHEDAYRHDYVVVKNKKRALPRFYDDWLEKHDPERMAEIKSKRLVEYKQAPHITEDRRLDMHLCRWQHHMKRLRETQDHESGNFHDLRQQSESVPKAILHAKRRYSFENVESDGV